MTSRRWLVATLFVWSGATRAETASADAPALFSHFEPAAVDAIEISGAIKVRLRKQGTEWLSEDGREADGQWVTQLLRAPAQMVDSELAAKGPSHYKQLRVDEASGQHYVFRSSGRTVADFTVAARAPPPARNPSVECRRTGQEWIAGAQQCRQAKAEFRMFEKRCGAAGTSQEAKDASLPPQAVQARCEELKRFKLVCADADALRTQARKVCAPDELPEDGTMVRVGSDVYRVRGFSGSQFNGTDWQERRIFNVPPESVTRLSVQLKGQRPYTLVRTFTQEQMSEGGGFGVQKRTWVETVPGPLALEDASVVPSGFPYDARIAEDVLRGVLGLSIREFLDSDPGVATTGLDDTADQWSITTVDAGGAETKRVVRVGKHRDQHLVYATSREQVFLAHTGSVEPMRRAVDDLRQFQVMRVEPNEVRELTTIMGKSRVVLGRDGKTWRVVSSTEGALAGTEIKESYVVSWLQRFGSFPAKGLANSDGLQTGLERPRAVISARLANGGTAVFSVGSELYDTDKGRRTYATGNVDGAIYLIDGPLALNIATSLLGLGRR